jgi:hypothetical protein
MKAIKKSQRIGEHGRILKETMALRAKPKRLSKAIPCDIYSRPSMTSQFRGLLVEQLNSEQ